MQTLRKYIFGTLVFAYFFSLVGLPVYFHYCGGQLEKISYYIKTDSCCDGEEQEGDDNTCCSDEGVYLINSTDFVLKNYKGIKPVEQLNQVVLHTLPSIVPVQYLSPKSLNLGSGLYPPGLHHPQVISTSVLRI